MTRKAAVFVDFENILLEMKSGSVPPPPGVSPVEATLRILSRLKKQIQAQASEILIGRSYGTWEYTQEALHSLAMLSLDPVYGLYKRGKNSADLELSLEAQEVLLTRPDIDMFVIVGGDRDYIPIVKRIHERGKEVVVVGFHTSTSGDLRNLVGTERFIDAGMFMDGGAHAHEEHHPPETSSAAATRQPAPSQMASEASHRAVASEDSAQAPPHEIEPEAALQTCLALLVEAERAHRSPSIWLTPFLRNYMNEAFVTLNNEERKVLLMELANRGAIRIEQRPGEMGTFSVVVLEKSHPMVKKAAGIG